MLFNSFVFILLFLPLTLAGFYGIGYKGPRVAALVWLTGMSLIFYGWWNPAYLLLLLSSIVCNFALASLIRASEGALRRRLLLALGVTLNLGAIGYYKYGHFAVETLNGLADTGWQLPSIVLPLAISFFTFQQIAYLADAYQGKVHSKSFIEYMLFVSFFPQLIAGPIVHHGEMMPQFRRRISESPIFANLSVGFTVFALGLFKKVILADGVAAFSNPVFNAAEAGAPLSFFDAWGGALAYTFQIYFDFSGYSDMAIGLGRMFGIVLPLNFNSPYKALNIIDFWRRWHMTLSRFLRDYLYIPLGGGRAGRFRRYANLMVVMVLGGLWHGAGWTFVIWGAYQGLLLMVNHIWRAMAGIMGWERSLGHWTCRRAGQALTFGLVVVGWVFFRAEDMPSAMRILEAMFTPPSLEHAVELRHHESSKGWWTIVLLGIVAAAAPNLAQVFQRDGYSLENGSAMPAWQRVCEFRFNAPWVAITVSVFLYAAFHMSKTSDFLYFNF